MLRQPATIAGWDGGCTFTLRGSRPQSILLTQRRMIRRAGVVACIYAGWPRDAAGRITGVRNQSADPPGARWIENKLGPTLLWAASGCERLCVQSMLLQFHVVIQRGTEAITVLDLAAPYNECPCLTPSWGAEPGVPAGAIDQPGCTIAALGDGFADARGKRSQVRVGDRAHIEFRQRALLYADDVFLGADEYGFTLDAELGRPAYAITAKLS